MYHVLQAKKVKDVKREGALKEVVGRDLRKARRLLLARLRDFQQLHAMVKTQRNRFVHLIQAARQVWRAARGATCMHAGHSTDSQGHV